MSAARPLRVDAERNRQRILEAARTLFAERGVDVSVDDIAAAAGVGIGTFYRRFPDRESLVEAVFATKLDRIVEAARAALEIEDPWEAFRTYVMTVSRMHAGDRGLKDVMLSTDRGREQVTAFRATIQPLAGALIERAKAAGVLREDISPFDIPLIHQAVGAIADVTRDCSPDYFERTLTLLVDGLAQQRTAPTPMSAPPLSVDQFLTIMARRR
ncbi:TetR/AcrR family transcriptional regulator [Solirubrobacter sp. CPCC 204708]|uniref:TetR/AcrR family transcriptional regulator n=1 Tax=Solirubrobacter deserti TaxID=2282478 RepID=A0ABT4RKC1_9ACTN|nr:TetR/AcrR family transcriptional regulator [Solirubrobacter deserti]MBE2316792.1 TetR/AcrR family transcriptional regulator [Solirubrobacter deserti]MDA0138993.1 TetR/AcrR family transcriptional regulator [Solirubrobacter deserti]